MNRTAHPELSVVIPVYNEEEGLQALFDRLYPALDALASPYEILFVNDGSTDRSAGLLAERQRARPDVTRVVLFNGNYGQHMAVLAGFEHARGDIVVTLDADLQNPPEEIGRLVEKIREGHDYVGTIRRMRQDSAWRKVASRWMNRLRERITQVRMTDQGCMLRAYGRNVIDTINQCQEVNTYIPALAYTFSSRPVEIEVGHEERAAGTSKYSLYKLIRLNFDLVTGFSTQPLQWFSFIGIGLSLSSLAFVVFLVIRRLIVGPEAEGVFTLFGISFFLIGVILFGIGLLGEYIGRIYEQVRRRPRYIVQVITHRDHPTEVRWFDSVAETAAELGLPVAHVEDLAAGQLRARPATLRPDYLFSFYFRSMLPADVLATARIAALNMHGSLLPKYRGRAPTNWAVLHGETETGATLHAMDAKPDHGAVVDRMAVPILPDDTGREVFDKVTVAAETILWQAAPDLLAGRFPRRPNDLTQGSYFGGRKPEDGRIDWARPAAEIYNLVRAVAPPYPGAFTDVRGRRIVVAKARRTPGLRPPPVGLRREGKTVLGVAGDGGLLRIDAVLVDGQPAALNELQL